MVTKIVFFDVRPSGDSTDALSVTLLVATPPLSSSAPTLSIVKSRTRP